VASRRRTLILGGSTEASALARRLAPRDDYDVIVSYAGRTRERSETPGAVRVGGFGGIDGLARYLRSESIDVLLDATHPFAAAMPHHAAAACEIAGVPRVRVCRPPWAAVAGDRWHEVPDLDAAAALLDALGARRVFLTTGRRELAPFARVGDAWFLVRAIEPPAVMPLTRAAVVLARGPFDEAEELALLTEHEIDVVVSKNSGGTAAMAKLHAARQLGLPVVMVARPRGPDGPVVSTVADALSWLAGPSSGPQEVSAG
jgi:precorrin-6A/cobalt-precorrin-6A reductase